MVADKVTGDFCRHKERIVSENDKHERSTGSVHLVKSPEETFCPSQLSG